MVVELIAFVAGVLLVAMIAAALAVRNVIHICQPNEVLIFSGKRRSGPDGRTLGYRIVQGGRGIRIPLFERVDKMDLTNMIVDVRVMGAYSKGGIPLNLQAAANIKVASHQPRLDNAIERLLGKPREEIMRIGRETLEGNLRGVLAGLTPEEVNEDRVSFERALLEESEVDLSKLGLVLDTLTIQSISDDEGYLASIGRQRSAELKKNATVAEARARAQAAVRDANNKQEEALARLVAQEQILRAEAARRQTDAETRASAMVAEAQSEIAAQKARAEAEVRIQEQRLEQIKRKLLADVLEPARAAMKEMQAEAEGRAAKIVEDGKANAEALEDLFDVWQEAGPNARELFLSHKLDVVLRTLLGTVKDMKVDKVTVIDSELSEVDERGTVPLKAASSVEQIKQTLGVDLAKVAAGLAAAKTK